MSASLPLGGMDVTTFLHEYWQKKPLLIRGAFPDFESPLEPNDLAGLACEEEVESRLVEVRGDRTPWQLHQGPFDEATFNRLGRQDWSLLVQAVDHWVPEVAELLEHFTFLPRWRLDDVMVSFAPPGGSVGPHVDNYDVFLLQGSGQRRWQLGGLVDEQAPIVEGIDLRILAHFEVEADQDWVLEPGDMLYIPPRIAHHGVSESEDCLTYSIGFRAPSMDEMVTSWADYLGEQLSETERYSDADLQPVSHPGEIDQAALERVRHAMLSALDDPTTMAQWFGRVMTQVRYPDQLIPPEQAPSVTDVRTHLAAGGELQRTLGSRFAWHGSGDSVTLFADGDGIACSITLARWLADTRPINVDILACTDAPEILVQLLANGSLQWVEESDEEET
ncbi:cupin domain-containing protein [Kushneria phosphatilytica]|uniref:Cupin domain-containing protein n=1 Tax=Kushneria phosphatilytica TaxID=657387 RepID=A0A1S1NV32_9GAMM|nr:cupin domain-containing protein [Kushneria phosphatilytica]OHV10045.1 transcription factor [Kushneria phosphatilytica]QEL11619.1 cupin domain-containing protein [Kushneria phosphatilytica]